MESRKYQLQQQIIEALKAKDNDSYTLLKSQWAHRYGVESLEELQDLNLKQLNQNSTNLDSQKIELSQENLIESDQPISIKDDDNQEKEIKTEKFESIKDENIDSVEPTSKVIIDKGIDEYKAINPNRENKTPPVVKTLIPLPPKPKYGYLKRWLLRK